jgi:hypothetical protein
MPYQKIDPSELKVWPITERKSLFTWGEIAQNPEATPLPISQDCQSHVRQLAGRMVAAKKRNASVILAYGAHLIKNGCGPLVNWLVRNGWVTHVATQGAGIIHDWEYAYHGASSESVRENAPVGKFGSWDETGKAINLALLVGGLEGLGFGEAIGRLIAEDGLMIPSAESLKADLTANPSHPLAGAKADMLAVLEKTQIENGRWDLEHPLKSISVPACCFDNEVPMTVHPGIGYDIFVNHPLFHGAAIGRAADVDVRTFAQSCLGLSSGVYLSVGSAIMSPQVFEKAFSAANNLRVGRGLNLIQKHFISIVDVQDGGNWDWSRGEPPKDNPAYYLRFCKSMHRMGGTVDYLCCDNRTVLSNLVFLLKHL